MFLSQTSPYRILIADDEASVRTVLRTSLGKEGFSVTCAQNGNEAIELLRASQAVDKEPFHAVITDLNMPGCDGMTLLAHVANEYENLPVIILTAHGTVDLAVQALKQGAFDFLSKPFERDEVVLTIKKALGQKTSTLATRQAFAENREKGLVGRSSQIQRIREIIGKVALSPSTVLITGESGTGKELVAHALHYGSTRKDKPFIRINCAAIPQTLIESELFGYERGAFTGAVTSKPGRFELADGGTLFLDEIGDLPIEVQVKLLRVLQESSFERVGGIKTIHVDFRLVAATNRDLQEAIADGSFREDLFYRLNVVPIHLPALRERSDDISALVAHFVQKYNARLSREVQCFTDEALAVLRNYDWPGNIRELENIVERTILFAEGSIIDARDLPPDVFGTRLAAIPHDASMKDIVRRKTAEIERDLIVQALDETGGNVTQGAKRLKISRKSLHLKMKELGLRPDIDSTEEA